MNPSPATSLSSVKKGAITALSSLANGITRLVGKAPSVSLAAALALVLPFMAASAKAQDSHWNQVTLFLQGDTANTGTVIDSSANNFTIATSGSPVQSSISPFGSGSGSFYFNGSSDYYTAPSSSAFDWQGGALDVTWEGWVYFTSLPSSTNMGIWGTSSALSDQKTVLYADIGGVITIGRPGLNGVSSATGVLSTNKWLHLAVVRNATANTTKVFVNGVAVVSSSNSAALWSSGSAPFYVGKWFNSASQFPGYMTNVRVLKGTALYSTNFTPPTSTLTAIANTSLLLKAENAKFVDSTGKNIMQAGGAPTISNSIYKFGSGSISCPTIADTVNVANAGSNYLFPGDFTIEGWSYSNNTAESSIFVLGNSNTYLAINGNTNYVAYVQSGGINITSTTPVSIGVWQHVALVRSGSTVTLYVDGQANGSTTATGTLGFANPVYCRVGGGGGGAGSKYIDDLRVTNGFARYTGNFTPGQAPALITQTAVSITSPNTLSPGQSYTATATGGSGTGSIVWALGSGSTAPGAAINSSTGVVTTTGAGTVVINAYRAADATYTQSATTSDFTITASVDVLFLRGDGNLTDSTGRHTTSPGGGVAVDSSLYKIGSGSIAIPASTTLIVNSAGTDFLFPGDFTVESWIYVAPGSTDASIFIVGNGSTYFGMNCDASNFRYYLNGAPTTAGSVTTNAWQHVALVRAGTTVTLYLNGSGVSSATGISGPLGYSSPSVAPQTNNGNPSVRRVDELRITNGLARYTGNFTPLSGLTAQAAVTINSASTATFGVPYTAIASGGSGSGGYVWALGSGSTASGAAINSSSGVVTANSAGKVVINAYRSTDGIYAQSATTSDFTVTVNAVDVLLIHADGDLVDASGHVTLNATGAAASSSSSPKIGSGSVSLPSVATDVVNFAGAGSNFSFTSDFTIELWAKTVSGADGSYFIVSNGSSYLGVNGDGVAGHLNWYVNSSSPVSTAGALPLNTWQHLALVRAGSTVTFYLDGAAVGSTTNSGTLGYSSPSIARLGGGNPSAKFVDEVRVTNGFARYTGTFTPPTTPVSNQPTVTITSAATSVYGAIYTATASGGNGTGAYVWSLGSGSTATGAAINSSTGVITANSAGTVVIKAYRSTDGTYAQSATTADFTVTIAPASIPGLRASWAMDEASGQITDSSGNGYNSVSFGSGVTVTSGKTGNGRAFSGASGQNTVSFGSQTPLPQGSNPFTIVTWFKPASNPGAGNYMTLSRFAHDGGQFFVNIFNGAGTVGVMAPFRNSQQYLFPCTPTVGSWNQLILAYNGGNKNLTSSYGIYLNGTQLTPGTNYGAAGGSATDTALGSDGSNVDGLFPGAMDNIQIYDHVLSGIEMSALATPTLLAQSAVTITSPSSGTVGTPYTATATGGSGSGAYVWSLGSGSTASGAAINPSTGVISLAGAGSVAIKAYRAGNATYDNSAITADFTVTFSDPAQAAPTWTTASTSLAYGAAYTVPTPSNSGQGALIWTRTGGTAAGGSVDSSTGAISYTGIGTIIMTATYAGNGSYSASPSSLPYTVTLTARSLPVTGVTAQNKIANGTTVATLSGTATISAGLVNGDTAANVILGGTPVATFATSAIANNVSVLVTGYSLSGTQAGNYTIVQPTGLTANITPGVQTTPTLTGTQTITYGGTATLTPGGGTGTGGYVYTVSGTAGGSMSGNVYTPTASGTATITVVKAADVNYLISDASPSVTITVDQASLTVTLAGSKVYDNTTASTGATASITSGALAGSDTISFSYAAASSVSAGSYPGLATATVSNTAAPTARTGSYSITYAGAYTINPTVNVTAVSAPSSGFTGSPVSPTLVTTPANAVVSYTVVGGTTATTATNSGLYTINWTTSGVSYTGSGTTTWSILPVSAQQYTTNSVVTVPAGVTSITAYVWGGGGGGQMQAAISGASGALVYSTLAVTPGQVLYVTTGGGGAGGTNYWEYRGTGGSPGGARSQAPMGGGGGGFSGIFTSSDISQATALLVAGGGGGATGAQGGQGIGSGSSMTAATNSGGGGGYVGATTGAGGGFSYSSGTNTNIIVGGNGANTQSFNPGPSISVAGVSYSAGAGGGGNGNINGYAMDGASGQVVITFTSLLTQSITFTPIDPQAYGSGPLTIAATTTSNLPLTYSLVSGPATLVGTTLTLAGVGTVTVQANQAGDANFGAASTTQTITVLPAEQAPLVITSGSSTYFGSGYAATVTGGTGNGAIVWSLGEGSTAPGAAIDANSGAITTTGVGAVVIKAYRAAWGNYAASAVTEDFPVTVTLAGQSIVSVTQNSTMVYGDAFTAGAMGGTGSGAYSFALGEGSSAVGAAVDANTGAVTAKSTGNVVINARRAASGNYTQSAVSADFTINVLARSITVAVQGSKEYDGTATSAGISASLAGGTLAPGDSLSFTYADAPSANVGNYSGLAAAVFSNASAPTSRTSSYSVSYTGSYDITTPLLTPATFTVTPTTFVYSGSAQGPTITPSDGAATFAVTGTPTATAAGAYSVTATANGSYSGASGLINWSITKAEQPAVSINSLANFTAGSAYQATATGGAGTGALSWELAEGSTAPGAGITSSGAVTSTSPGTVVIRVRRLTDTNYLESAPSADFTITIQPRTQTVVSGGSSVVLGVSFTPTVTVLTGTSTGATQMKVGAGEWVALASLDTSSPGSQSFMVRKLGDASHLDSPEVGPYTLTVTLPPQTNVSSAGGEVAVNVAFTPVVTGGSGTGAYQMKIGSGAWQALGALDTTTDGRITFYVRRAGDIDHAVSNEAGPYYLTMGTLNKPQTIAVRANNSAIWETAAGTQIFRKANTAGTGVESVTIMQIKGQSTRVVNGNGTVTDGFTSDPGAVTGPDDYAHLLFGMEKDDIEK